MPVPVSPWRASHEKTTYSGKDQQVARQHESARLHKTIHNSPDDENSADNHERPTGDEDLQSLIRAILVVPCLPL